MESETQSHEEGQSTGDKTGETIRSGRPLVNGSPIDEPTLELDPESPASILLQQSPRPLVSDPVSRTWATLLERPDSGNTDRPVLVQWVSPDSPEPPAHYHPKTETFKTLEGQLTVVRDGEPIQLDPGESLTVEPGHEHTFRNDTNEIVAFKAELPSIRMVKGLYTAWGLAHKRGRDEGGNFPGPGPVESLVIAADLYDETVMTMVPQSVQRVLWATAGRIARLSGATGITDGYLDASFWNRHVEQPELESPKDVTGESTN
ncbi:cupin domain-containing protein [Halorientalis salina]|uniref:cupin domain-containing protein n=1 Tax=Halorientalis salina TaxID=2932266 RepID=UPI0010AD5483|nr:cupin domain-containing protein [Halorientalis salina]